MLKPTTTDPAALKDETPEILQEGGGNGENGKRLETTAGANPPRKFSTINPQVLRTLRTLINGDHTRREGEPRIGTTYEPNHIRTLRTRYGLHIRTDWRKVQTRDGDWTRIGVYRLVDFAKAHELLRGARG